MLMDIGPREDGTIPEEQIAVLKEFGRWTKKHKEAIYDTRAGIPADHFQGFTSLNQAGDILYLYLPYRPNGIVEIKGIFSQLVSFLPKRVFDGIVKRHEGDKRVKHFTCWNQLLVMMFGQLAGCDSLREVAAIIDAIKSKSYHLGFGSGDIKLSNLSYANANRDYKIFEEFAYPMINLAQSKRITRPFVLNGKFYAFDSTTIDLCMRSVRVGILPQNQERNQGAHLV